MISGGKILLRKAYSIDLYAINLNEKFVPEGHALASSEGRSIVRVAKAWAALTDIVPCQRMGLMEKTIDPHLTVEHQWVFLELKRQLRWC
jgi:hypothetical protein